MTISRDTRPLTRREVQVLDLVSQGYQTQDIAAALQITPRTVTAHVSCIMRKLHARTRAHAVAIAYRNRLLT